MLVLRKADVEKILGGREKEHIELVRQTYSLPRTASSDSRPTAAARIRQRG
jgi:hypothetical protein